jgi:hypothetical protein
MAIMSSMAGKAALRAFSSASHVAQRDAEMAAWTF